LDFAAAGFSAAGFSAPATIDERAVIVIAKISNVLDIFDFKSFILQSPKNKHKIEFLILLSYTAELTF
jgi:hypothetical protein